MLHRTLLLRRAADEAVAEARRRRQIGWRESKSRTLVSEADHRPSPGGDGARRLESEVLELGAKRERSLRTSRAGALRAGLPRPAPARRRGGPRTAVQSKGPSRVTDRPTTSRCRPRSRRHRRQGVTPPPSSGRAQPRQAAGDPSAAPSAPPAAGAVRRPPSVSRRLTAGPARARRLAARHRPWTPVPASSAVPGATPPRPRPSRRPSCLWEEAPTHRATRPPLFDAEPEPTPRRRRVLAASLREAVTDETPLGRAIRARDRSLRPGQRGGLFRRRGR
jgi:hypothetical protein